MANIPTRGGSGPTPAEQEMLAMMGGQGGAPAESPMPEGAMPPAETPQEQGAEGETSAKEKVKTAVADIRTRLDSLESLLDSMP